jgi:hypothetical protein
MNFLVSAIQKITKTGIEEELPLEFTESFSAMWKLLLAISTASGVLLTLLLSMNITSIDYSRSNFIVQIVGYLLSWIFIILFILVFFFSVATLFFSGFSFCLWVLLDGKALTKYRHLLPIFDKYENIKTFITRVKQDKIAE